MKDKIIEILNSYVIDEAGMTNACILEDSIESIAFDILELYEPKIEKINWEKLLEFINSKTGRSFRFITPAVKKKFLARLKEGYTKEDIMKAIENASKDEFHNEHGNKWLKPDYFARASTIDQYSVIVNNTPKRRSSPLKLD